jgi:hypothetical protein
VIGGVAYREFKWERWLVADEGIGRLMLAVE